MKLNWRALLGLCQAFAIPWLWSHRLLSALQPVSGSVVMAEIGRLFMSAHFSPRVARMVVSTEKKCVKYSSSLIEDTDIVINSGPLLKINILTLAQNAVN